MGEGCFLLLGSLFGFLFGSLFGFLLYLQLTRGLLAKPLAFELCRHEPMSIHDEEGSLRGSPLRRVRVYPS